MDDEAVEHRRPESTVTIKHMVDDMRAVCAVDMQARGGSIGRVVEAARTDAVVRRVLELWLQVRERG